MFSGNAHAANEIYGEVKNSVDDFPVENAEVWYCTSTVPEEFPTCQAEFIGKTNQDGKWKLSNPIPNYYYRIWATKPLAAYSKTETFYYSGGSHYGGILGMTGISQTSGITVLEPSKGCVPTGKPVQPFTINWSTTISNIDHFIIGYIESDVPYHSIAEVQGNLRSYSWTPPIVNNVWARIAVVAEGPQGQFLGQDFSDVQFQMSLTCPTTTLQASNIRVVDITDTTVHVLWETNMPAVSTVEYKIETISRPDGFATVVTSNFITTHDTLLTYLLPNTTYYYYIRLWDSAKNEVRTETLSFKTASSPVTATKPAPQAEICYTCPQPVIVQPNTIEQTPQQPQPETKEVTQELQGKIQEFVLKLQEQAKMLQTEITRLNTQVQSQGRELVAVKLELQFTKTIQRGARGDDVLQLQEFLRNFPDVYPEGVVSGYFGPMTEVAVKRFQEKNGLEPVGIVGPKTRVALNTQSSANGNCANSTTRPCFDRVTPGKTVGLPTKAGESSLKACLSSKSPSLRGFAHTKTTLSELESYQYCFEGKSTAQVRYFMGSGAELSIVPRPSQSPKPKLSCTLAPEFSTLGWLDPDAPWSISEPSRIIGDHGFSYIYSFVVDTMLKTKSGTLFAAGYGLNSSAGWVLVVHKSIDGGVSWNSVQLPDVAPNWGFVHSMVEDNNGVIYAGGTGLWKSIDGGSTWTSLPMPFPDTYWGGSVPIYRMTIAKNNALIAAFGTGYSAGASKVYRSADTGSTWNELFSHGPIISSVIEADDGSLVFRSNVGTASESNVYRYSNGTITKTFTDLFNLSEPSAGLLKARDGAFYLVSVDKSVDINTIEYTEPGHAFLAAYKSTDNGITWTKLGTLPNSWTMQNSPIEDSLGTLYAASFSVCDKKDAVYKSTDKGMTWNIIGASPTFGNDNPDLYYYFKIRDIIEVSGKVLVGGNAPVIFSTR